MFKLCKKLKFLKESLKALNQKQFSHISSRAAAVKDKLCDIQQKLHDNPTNTLIQEQLVELKSSALKLAEAERSFCSQLTKMKFLKESDKGSKFFHDLIKSNKSKSQIVSLTLSVGSRTTSLQPVSKAFLNFYKGLLGSSSPCSQLDNPILLDGEQVSGAQASDLIRAVSDEDIKSALFSIGDDKSPGLDGFSAYFFKRAWSTVGSDFCEAIREFFSSGQLLKQMNHSIIALVPKSTSAPEWNTIGQQLAAVFLIRLFQKYWLLDQLMLGHS